MATDTYFTDLQTTPRRLNSDVLRHMEPISFAIHNGTSGDTVNLAKIPADFFVEQAGLRVITGEAGTHTLGDADAANSWDASINTVSAGNFNSTPSDTNGALGGLLYTALNYLTLTLGADMNSGVFMAWYKGHYLADES